MDQAENIPQQNKLRSMLLLGGIVLVVIAGGVLFTSIHSYQPASTVQTQQQQPQQTPVDSSSKSNDASAAPTGERKDVMITGGNYYFKPNIIRVKKGDTVKIIFTNSGGMHDFVIDEFKVQTKTLQDGAQETATFTPDKSGIFDFYCSVGNHRQMGMQGKLIVE